MGKYPHTQAGEEPGYEGMGALVIQYMSYGTLTFVQYIITSYPSHHVLQDITAN